jgi:hypothetical protein
VRAAFSCRDGGVSGGPYATLNLGGGVGDEPRAVAENRRRFAAAFGFAPDAAAGARQVHGAEVVAVTAPGAAGAADGLCTDVPGVVLTIAVADCAAVFLADGARGAVALCHAGWRGAAAGIAGAAVAALGRRFGCRPEDLHACISPCIGPCCYEVDAPVLAAFGPRACRFLPGRPGHARLDLPGSLALQLRQAGLRERRIAAAGLCTACEAPWLYSHRRDHGRTGRMHAALWLHAP